MPVERLSRRALGLFLAGFLLLTTGCKNDEIPLVVFPNGPPPPPPRAKEDPNGPQGKNTSQGDPMQYSK